MVSRTSSSVVERRPVISAAAGITTSWRRGGRRREVAEVTEISCGGGRCTRPDGRRIGLTTTAPALVRAAIAEHRRRITAAQYPPTHCRAPPPLQRARTQRGPQPRRQKGHRQPQRRSYSTAVRRGQLTGGGASSPPKRSSPAAAAGAFFFAPPPFPPPIFTLIVCPSFSVRSSFGPSSFGFIAASFSAFSSRRKSWIAALKSNA